MQGTCIDKTRRVAECRRHYPAARNWHKCFLMMKMTTFLIFVVILQVHARSYGQQEVTLSAKNITVEKLFKELEQKTGYSFIYDSRILNDAYRINLRMRNVPLARVLDKCLAGMALAYRIDNQMVFITAQKASAADTSNETVIARNEAISSDIHGHVTDSTGKPMSNVIVTVKGTNQVTITDNNGNYSFANVDPAKAVLVFSFVGYATQEIALNGRNEVSITLKELPQQLEDVGVMVNIGYQVLPKERATGSFVFIDSPLLNRRVGSSILDRLEGVTSGLVFNKGVETNITIRGVSTIYANKEPLYVVDNFPYAGDIKNINPNDIDNITVLKDAAAASIWGVQAGNGGLR